MIYMALASLFLSFTPQLALAQAQQPETQASGGGFVPCGNTADNPCNVSHLFKAFILIVNYLIDFAGFIAVGAIILAGLQMVLSQGQDGLVQAKRRFTGAIIGMVIVAAAFVLINAIFAGSLTIGVQNGGQILTNPKAYINGQ